MSTAEGAIEVPYAHAPHGVGGIRISRLVVARRAPEGPLARLACAVTPARNSAVRAAGAARERPVCRAR
jgi:hypothetical protein